MTLSAPIDRDIRWLDTALGRVVAEQCGKNFATRISRLVQEQKLSNTPEAYQQIARALARMDGQQLRAAIRYVSLRLELMNLAEDRHRIRVLHERSKHHPKHPRPGSIADAVRQLRRSSPQVNLAEAAQRLSVELVLTAHPTDAKRRTIRHALRTVRRLLDERWGDDLSEARRTAVEAQLHAVLTAVWQTDLVRPTPPTVRQEIQRGLNVAKRLWPVAPRVARDLREAMSEAVEGETWTPLRFGSWIGGDRDGHPFVTTRETAYALRASRRLALRLHARTARRILPGLAISTRKQPADAAIKKRIEAGLRRFPAVKARVEAEPATELYRRMGRMIHWRLRQTLRDAEGRYATAGQLLADVQAMDASLRHHDAAAVAEQVLGDWLVQIRTFGFHMLALDVRQDSEVYAEVIAELMEKAGQGSGYLAADEAGRRKMLARTRGKIDGRMIQGLSDQATETVDLFRLLRRTLAQSPEAIGGHVISMTHQVSDLLAVPWLLAAGREAGQKTDPPLAVMPLFETVDDLERASVILDELFSDKAYQRLLKRQGGRQTVMIGYSDSTKDGGYLAACWKLYESQDAMHQVSEAHGVDLTFFHGRGGSLGRGGGPAARSIESLPAHTVNGRIRMTEQGEVLVERYDDPRIGYRHLEQIVASTLLTMADSDDDVPSKWRDLLSGCANRSVERYHQLTGHEKFIEYFRSATPINEIEKLQIGSRPARRRSQRSLKDLRAIPWVFAWTQSRHMVPAWFGVGELIDGKADQKQVALLRGMYERWGFFQSTVDNAALAFAKLDADLIGEYAKLADKQAGAVCDEIQQHAERAAAAVRTILGVEHVLDEVPWLRESVAVRNPWVSVLNIAQVMLIKRKRTEKLSKAERADVEELIRKTIYGVATGLRTTG